MTFIATREVFSPYTNDHLGNFGPYALYKVFQDDTLIADLLCKNIISSFSFANQEYSITTNSELFRKTKYFLTNKTTGEQLAEFKISDWRRFFHKEIGTVNFSEYSLVCNHSNPNIFKSPFFSLYSNVSAFFSLQQNETVISYCANYKTLNFDEFNSYRPSGACTIEISSPTIDLVPVCCGLFLIEKYFGR